MPCPQCCLAVPDAAERMTITAPTCRYVPGPYTDNFQSLEPCQAGTISPTLQRRKRTGYVAGKKTGSELRSKSRPQAPDSVHQPTALAQGSLAQTGREGIARNSVRKAREKRALATAHGHRTGTGAASPAQAPPRQASWPSVSHHDAATVWQRRVCTSRAPGPPSLGS